MKNAYHYFQGKMHNHNCRWISGKLLRVPFSAAVPRFHEQSWTLYFVLPTIFWAFPWDKCPILFSFSSSQYQINIRIQLRAYHILVFASYSIKIWSSVTYHWSWTRQFGHPSTMQNYISAWIVAIKYWSFSLYEVHSSLYTITRYEE